MTLAQARQRTYTLYSGESDTPDSDTSALILLYLNIMKDRWALEPGVQWNSLRSLVTLKAVDNTTNQLVTATDTFPLNSAKVNRISKQEGDYVTILRPDGRKTTYTLVAPTRLYTTETDNPCAVFGGNLVFGTAFTAGQGEIGGTIIVPMYVSPPDVAADADLIPVDDPDWTCFMAAAELAANDVTKADMAPRLMAYAADSMNAMKENNEPQSDEVYEGYSMLGWMNNE